MSFGSFFYRCIDGVHSDRSRSVIKKHISVFSLQPSLFAAMGLVGRYSRGTFGHLSVCYLLIGGMGRGMSFGGRFKCVRIVVLAEKDEDLHHPRVGQVVNRHMREIDEELNTQSSAD